MEKIFTKSLKTNLIFKLLNKFFLFLFVIFFISTSLFADVSNKKNKNDKYKFEKDEVVSKAKIYFADLSEGVAIIIERTFSDFGNPTAYVEGEEFSGAFFGGLRYGKGKVFFKDGTVKKVYWNGPSIGFDFGGNAAKVFTLIYNLNPENFTSLIGRYPEAEGNLFLAAGLAVNYQKKDDIIVAPIRSGIGLRAGVNLGYIKYTEKRSILPF